MTTVLFLTTMIASVLVPFNSTDLLTLPAPNEQVESEAARLFSARVEKYVIVREELRELVHLRLEPTDEQTAFTERRRLGHALRVERADVRSGNIFGDVVQRWFRGMTSEAMQSASCRRWLTDRQTFPVLKVQVNDRYPLLAEHDVHVSLLQILPDLPANLVYRVVGTDLVLWDEGADLVVDVLREAFAVATTVERRTN